ncbi:hypothetical protein AHAS_Ahas13G0277900 [Arachis hypogaea]
MSKNRDKEPLLDPDPEPERSLRRHLQQAKACKTGENLTKSFEKEAEETNMARGNPNAEEHARKVPGSYTAPTADFYGRSISVPAIGANNFELKPQQICDTVKTNGVNPEVYKLMIFPFVVRDRAKLWLDYQPKESLDTWDNVVTEFLAKFFLPQKLSKLRVEHQTFRQKERESFYEAWERYKQLIRMATKKGTEKASNKPLVRRGKNSTSTFNKSTPLSVTSEVGPATPAGKANGAL